MHFRKWLETVATASQAPPKPPDVDKPDDGNRNEDYEHFNNGFHQWIQKGACFKQVVSLFSKEIEEHLKVEKTDFRTAPVGGFADVYMKADNILVWLLQKVHKLLLGHCDLWQFLKINYTEAANLMMRPKFTNWLDNNLLMAVFGNPVFIGNSSPTDNLASFLVYNFFKKRTDLIKELARRIKEERPKADLIFDKTHGTFRIKYPNLHLVGYYQLHANEDMFGAGDYVFDVRLTNTQMGNTPQHYAYMEVFHHKNGNIGRLDCYWQDKIITPISGYFKNNAIFTLALEMMAEWSKENSYQFKMPKNRVDNESWEIIKRFFERH